jgi:hypothetical protein
MPEAVPLTSPELDSLRGEYDIVGELGGHSTMRAVIATARPKSGKQRDDGGRVLIEIVRKPEGDEAHALDHLASDTKILGSIRHRRLIPILEGRWLGEDAFAVVRERIDDPSLAEKLGQGEPFTNTRAAAILREVHGLLEWAREQNIVHRAVSPDRIFLEPMSDRVRIAFGVSALQRIRTTDPAVEDSLTVVRLAMAMLTGRADPSAYEGRSLAEMRPDLPERLLEESATLLEDPSQGVDIPSYLALIGMADPVAEGESERDRIRAEVLEEQRVEREKLASERTEFERLMAEERRKLAAESEELRRIFAQEKATMERAFAAAQQKLDVERTQMQRILADERVALVAKRAELEKDVAARRAAIEYAAAEDRLRMQELREEIKRIGEAEVERKRTATLDELHESEIHRETTEMAAPNFVAPMIRPLDEITFRDADPLAPSKRRVSAPEIEPSAALESAVASAKVPHPTGGRRRPTWLMPAAIAATVLVVASTAVVIANRPSNAADARRPAPKVMKAPPVARTVPAQPAVAPPVAAQPAPPAAVAAAALPLADSVTARRWLDSLREAYPITIAPAVRSDSADRALRARAVARWREALAADSMAQLVPGARVRIDTSSAQNQNPPDAGTIPPAGTTPP